MQQFPHRDSRSNTPMLLAAAGLGALLAYALSSPRRRAAMSAAGHAALDAGSRLASASAERLRAWMPEAQETWDRFATQAAGASDELEPSAAGRLHRAADVTSAAVRRAAERARALTAQAGRHARDTWDDLHGAAADAPDERSDRGSVVGPLVAAAALGASLYAMRRSGGAEAPDRLGDRHSGAMGASMPVGAAPDEMAR